MERNILFWTWSWFLWRRAVTAADAIVISPEVPSFFSRKISSETTGLFKKLDSYRVIELKKNLIEIKLKFIFLLWTWFVTLFLTKLLNINLIIFVRKFFLIKTTITVFYTSYDYLNRKLTLVTIFEESFITDVWMVGPWIRLWSGLMQVIN